MKKSILFFIISILGNLLIAQNFDSLLVVNGNWKHDTLASGLILKNIKIDDNSLFNSNQNIYILEIDISENNFRFKIASSSTLTLTSDFCKRNNTLAAINGTFFFMKSGISTDYLRVNGKKIASNTEKEGKRKSYKNGLLAIQNGQMTIILPDSNINFEDNLPFDEIMTSGPMLLYDYQQLPFIQNSFTLERHNRTGVAMNGKDKIMFIVVDGKMKEAAGMTLKEFGSVLKWLGAKTMLNLDGGGSTTLFINLPDYGIINHPSDNNKYDHYGERKVANALLLLIEN